MPVMKRLSFNRWDEFRYYIDKDSQILPAYWRGQKDPSWPLASPFERIFLRFGGRWKKGASTIYPYDGRFLKDGKPIWTEGFYQGTRDLYLKSFKQAASGLRGGNPAQLSVDQWWALGRHYGLVTPLLDWTEKPYIAAFFALVELYNEMKQMSSRFAFEAFE